MAEIVRINDPSNHGGRMVTATGGFTVNGLAVCVNGDMHECPIEGHGTTSVTASHTQFGTDGKPVLVTNDIAGCGAAISSGSTNTTPY